MNVFEIISDRVRIEEVCEYYGIYLNKNYKALCPFPNHKEKTPSFSVSKSKNIFNCFGCGEKGNSITLVSKLLNCTPYEAAKQLNIIFNCGVDFKVDKSKPKFEHEKDFAKYNIDKKKQKNEDKTKKDIYDNLFEVSCINFRYWYELNKIFKMFDIEKYKDELSIIYKNEMIFENIFNFINNSDIETIYKNKEYLIRILKKGIKYMDFDKIALIAFREDDMPNSSSNIELLTYYKLKELYIKHYRKQLNDEDAKLEKQKIKAFFDKQTSFEEFNKKIQNQICDNINLAQNETIKLMKMINNKTDVKQICDVAINCISHLTDDFVLKKVYNENY